MVDNGLIHRDFRTTNLMVSERRSTIRVRVIDLGHTILAENHQCRNKSAVVRCNWKEEEKKRFDWAPPEVGRLGCLLGSLETQKARFMPVYNVVDILLHICSVISGDRF